MKHPYEIAIETRNFELKLFWYRSLFFAGFVSAIFAGFTDEDMPSHLKLLLASLGGLISMAWSLANRGSKYWFEVWEGKIAKLEEKDPGIFFPLFSENEDLDSGKCCLFQSRRYSVSRLAIFVTDLITLVWIIILGCEIGYFFKPCLVGLTDLCPNMKSNGCYGPAIYLAALAFILWVLFIGTRSSKDGNAKSHKTD